MAEVPLRQLTSARDHGKSNGCGWSERDQRGPVPILPRRDKTPAVDRLVAVPGTDPAGFRLGAVGKRTTWRKHMKFCEIIRAWKGRASAAWLLLPVVLITAAGCHSLNISGAARACYNSGLANFKHGNYEAAIADYTQAIGLQPDFAPAYNNRGAAKRAQRDLDGALADFNIAIKLKPDLAMAYDGRGNVKKARGDLAGAIADYNTAIDLKPGDVAAHLDRGGARKIQGDAAGAMADFNQAIELKPESFSGYYYRGCLRYDAHEFPGALAEFQKVLELNGTNHYTQFRVWLIRARQGEAEAATAELQKQLGDRLPGKPDDWVAQIGHFLTGQLAEPDFLAAAKNGDPKKEARQWCEACFYAGSKHLFAGDRAMASDFFQKTPATEKRNYSEYASAVAELRFLQAEK